MKEKIGGRKTILLKKLENNILCDYLLLAGAKMNRRL